MKNILIAVVLLFSMNTHAQLIYLNFEGHITDVGHDLLDEQFSIGDRFRISVSIRTDAEQTSQFDANSPWFGNAVNNLRVTSGDYFAELDYYRDGYDISGEGSCGVAVHKASDTYNIQACQISDPFNGRITGDTADFTVRSDYLEIFGISQKDIETLADFPLRSEGAQWGFRNHFNVAGMDPYIEGVITRMSVSEPATFALLGLGLAGLSLVRRKA